jgi:magnesium-transporting ATPase (P-type)
LSAAQVGIAVEGATDAAKNAADLILTEPGLSPIYGAVLESRRIFARIKAYVIYRVAASAILVLLLSTVIFTSGCAVNSLLVIILALLNDISMIPVAYDNAKATVHPQLPDATKLVLMSLYYAGMHTGFGLGFLLTVGHRGILTDDIELTNDCTDETQGLVWLYLVLVTELAIFSVRSPKFFWKSIPSPLLIGSVLLTCAVGTIIAILAMDLQGEFALWVWLYNIVAFVIVDVLKVVFKKVIHDIPGDTIDSDELVQVGEAKSEATKHAEKGLRQVVHRQSTRPPSEIVHNIEIFDEGSDTLSMVFNSFARMGPETYLGDGYIYRPTLAQVQRLRSVSAPVGGPLFY